MPAEKHLSISQRLGKARSLPVVEEIARDWGDRWRQQQREAVEALFVALDGDDIQTAYEIARLINDLTHKGFAGLPSVIDRLVDVQRPATHDPASRKGG